jgi:2-deoxy-D-gluconate 3-dehydrogenase
LDFVIESFRIDIVLNAAGIMRRIPAEKFDFENYDAVIQTNLSATFGICRDIGAFWLENKIKGSIINVASLASFQGGIIWLLMPQVKEECFLCQRL